MQRQIRTTVAALLAFVLIGAAVALALIGFASGPSSATTDPAEGQPASLTVEAGCDPAPADCAAAINQAISTNDARPLMVTFGAGSAPGTSFRFGSPVRIESDVYVHGVNRPQALADTANLFRVAGTSNVSVRGFDIDMQQCNATNSVFYGAPNNTFANLHISDMNVFNGNADDPDPGLCEFLRSNSNGDGLRIHDVTADGLRRFVWLTTQSDHTDVELVNVAVTTIGYQALSFNGLVDGLLIEGGLYARHAPNIAGSHIISFSSSTSPSDVRSRNVTIRGTTVEGNPDTPYIRLNRVTTPNGAAGDLIAVRGTDGFLVENNTVRHSGEVGITISGGSKNGVVRNNVISFTDTTGIVLGNPYNLGVANVDVYGNELFANSLDRADSHNPLPVLSVWNARASCVANNYIHDNPEGTGLWVWNGHRPPSQPRSVFDLYITANVIEDNFLGFVQSARPARDFEPASSNGGANWTSTFGAPDIDGDGFGTVCSSETDDADPCVPYADAVTCTGGPTTTTTQSTTTTQPSTTTTQPTTTTSASTTSSTAPTTTTTQPTTTLPTTTTTVGGTPTCGGFVATLVGTEQDDVLIGTNRRDVIVALGGNDLVYGNGGNDVICGGPGNDELRGGRNNDTIYGGDGVDVIKGGRDNDVLSGDGDDDIIFGNNGRDTASGGEGNDIIRGNNGRDTLDGGPGDDYLAGNRDVDTLRGGPDEDTLLGGPHNDSLNGGSGEDACAGAAGNDLEVACESSPATTVDEYDYTTDDGNLD